MLKTRRPPSAGTCTMTHTAYRTYAYALHYWAVVSARATRRYFTKSYRDM